MTEEVEHRLLGQGIGGDQGQARCTCGGWTARLGTSVWRGFDQHLLDVRSDSTR